MARPVAIRFFPFPTDTSSYGHAGNSKPCRAPARTGLRPIQAAINQTTPSLESHFIERAIFFEDSPILVQIVTAQDLEKHRIVDLFKKLIA